MSFSAVGVVVVMIIAQRFCIMIEFRNAMFIYMKSNSVELTFIKLNFIILRFVCIECNKKNKLNDWTSRFVFLEFIIR